MTALDNWLIDGEHLQLSDGTMISCRGLKAAIRVEIDAKMRAAFTAFVEGAKEGAAKPSSPPPEG